MQLPLAELPDVFLFVIAGVLLIFCLVLLIAFSMLVRPWMRALLSGEPVALFSIFGMRLRGNPPNLLIDAYIVLRKRGVDTTISEIENTYIDSKTRIFNYADLVDVVESRKSSEQRGSM